jgi:hypothetical protein
LSFVLPSLVVVATHFRPCVVHSQQHLAWDFSSDPAQLLLVKYILFMYGTIHVLAPCPPPAAFAPQEPVIFENMSRGSRDQSALEDSCCQRLGGLRLGTLLVPLQG